MNKINIINFWKELGWNNIKDYSDFLKSHTYLEIEEKLGDKLHPDNINVKEFWRAAEDVFATDPVCNSIGESLKSIEESNKLNNLIPLFLGLLGGLEVAIFNIKRYHTVHIAEIGAGYGSFEDGVINNRNDIYSYTGFDIIPRREDQVELMGENGSFSDEQLIEYKDKFNIFYSCNVFQHLSEKQIRKYLKDIFNMLPHYGFFVLSYVNDEDGIVKSTKHYGQIINILSKEKFKDIIRSVGFKILFEYIQHHGTGLKPIGFVLEKNYVG